MSCLCAPAGAANEGVLANFFNSLLSKKTGAPGSPGTGAAGTGVQGSAKKTGTTLYSSAFTWNSLKQPVLCMVAVMSFGKTAATHDC